MNEKMTIAVIYGSARQGRFCDTVVNWVLTELWAESGIRITLIDPLELKGPADDAAINVGILEQRIADADAFIVVTPEYNHGYPAALKELIDSCYAPWHAKSVGFISYGGVSGGLRAVEQLRQVFAELHTVTIRDTVSFSNVWSQFDAAGNPFKAVEAKASLLVMLRRLKWWARALKTARRENAYSGVAA
ncbi:NAD(P)H-dependent oxidoreductase [Pararhizobium sp. BT-229]|uniref:NADPH-dependent FMN reductase n=1 Tax=Pararhizobium sp. BT-229 TaxID=2986923 RepID=UPI0021F70C5F|nr:NAD(P)H-dependent oxidoreductase [Pararhizobium sp. BT-229]MCV9960593.1 NAD(P)H-dependent oxidoreductase [Pararhizobium sp. BT-229]